MDIEELHKIHAIDWNKVLSHGCITNDTKVIDLAIQHETWNMFNVACVYGNMYAINALMPKREYSWNCALTTACRNGHYELAKLFIEKGAYNLNSALGDIRFGCNYDIMILLIEKGADYPGLVELWKKRHLLNLGLNTTLVSNDSEFSKIITERKERINQMTPIIDEILYDIYKDKQIYDKNVISIITQYIMY